MTFYGSRYIQGWVFLFLRANQTYVQFFFEVNYLQFRTKLDNSVFDISPLTANPTKWSNTFGHYVNLALKVLEEYFTFRFMSI